MDFVNDLLGTLAASGAINLTPAQINQESGGNQFDPKTGKPLTSKKGAVGIAQVMEATGPEAAAAAGVPWDRNKWLNDAAYNQKIGDAYQGKLNKRFADDPIAATAAYNAGPTRVAKLKAQYGDNWARYLPQETKDYLKRVKGVDVGTGYYAGSGGPANTSQFISDVSNEIGLTKDYVPGLPTAGEQVSMRDSSNVVATPDSVDIPKIQAGVAATQTASDNYTQYLQTAVEPLRQNQAAQLAHVKTVADVKRGLANDFAHRESDLEGKIVPLMDAKQKLIDHLQELDQMNPLDKRLKAIFNPERYDPRMVRGQIERLDDRINGLQGNYEDLNKLRAGVAAASVDAEAGDVATLETARSNTLADLTLLGQVVTATQQNTTAGLFGLDTSVNTLRLTEAAKQDYIGKQSTEGLTSLYQQAQSSPDGTLHINGMNLTVGELQQAARASQAQDLTAKNMVNAFKVQDLHTADELETHYISHMNRAQIGDALKHQGKVNINGTEYQLSLPKLTEALGTAQAQADALVNQTVMSTAPGLAASVLHGIGADISSSSQRAVEMFGNLPGEMNSTAANVQAQIQAWNNGLNTAKANGTATEYIAKTMPTITGLQQAWSGVVDNVAKKWGGGNTAMESIASAYLHGNPIGGDAAIKGLVQIARTGLPAGAKLSGPAAQAVEAARSLVREWDHPQAGDSIESIMKGGTKKESDLYRLIQDRVGSIYADAVTDAVIKDFPALARTVKDPNNPSMPHPFSRVNQQDFIMAIQHGDAQGYAVVGQQLGVDAATAKRILSSGVDSAEWQAIAQKKGWNNDKFAEVVGALQSIQMSETLTALDASHSARPGFSPAKAYVDFLQTQEVQNKVDQAVSQYGNSSFGAYLVSSSAGGGYRDAWTAYTQAVGNQYFLNHGQDLQRRIAQQRSMGGDPFVRFAAVNRAIGLTPQESNTLLAAVKPLATHIIPQNSSALSLPNMKDTTETSNTYNANNFDQITNIIRNHKFDDPTIEKLRKRVDSQWDAMDAIVGNVFDAVNN